jgi:hypothetical protein
MRTKVAALRTHAYAMRGLSAPADGTPKTPLITSVTGSAGAGVVAWRGAAIADTYTIERATAASSGPFTVICNKCVTDNPGTFTDTGAVSGSSWYRITGFNLSNVAGPTSPVFAASL